MKNKLFTILMAIVLPMTLTSCQWLLYGVVENLAHDYDDPTEPVHISGVKIGGVDNSAVTLTVGNTLQLTAIVTPDNTAEKEVNWVSENSEVATVTEAGLVTAVAKGSTMIRVVSEANAAVSAALTITVVEEEVDLNGNPIDQSEAESRKM